MLLQNEMQRYIKSKVGNAFQDNVELLFEFLLSHPSLLKWTNVGAAIVNGNRITGSHIYNFLDFMIEGNCPSNHNPKSLEELIKGLSLLGFDLNNLANQRGRVIMSIMHKQNVNQGVKKIKAIAVRKTLLKWLSY